mmetsp:Transcript_43353/g.131882  ORF Transcript_43353/g.131882 Transcript_43353/m.131882 type:complete len:387 (-) Transcript_43353:77-1237(-)
MELEGAPQDLLGAGRVRRPAGELGYLLLRNGLSSSLASVVAAAAAAAAPSFPDQLRFLSTIVGSLKLIKRTGWVRSGIPLPESDADHMHRCALTSMLVSQPRHPDDIALYERGEEFRRYDHRGGMVDAGKLLRMAVTHDLCESLAGDVTPHCHATLVESKEAKENAAMEEIRRVVGDPLGGELYGLWREYEDQETVEAIYCKDIDKFEMVCQAYEYERDHLAFHSDEREEEVRGGQEETEGKGVDKKEEKGETAKGTSDRNEDGGKGSNDGGDGFLATSEPPVAKKPRTSPSDDGETTKTQEETKQNDAPTSQTNEDDGLHLPPKICSETTDAALSEPLRTFFVSTSSVMKTPLFRRLDGELRTKREDLLRGRGWTVTEEERQRYD